MAFWKALIVNLAVVAIWFLSEYQQYGELQWDRECDNIVFWVYFFILWYLFSRYEEKKMLKKFIRWGLRQLMLDECQYHGTCNCCPYGTEDCMCVPLEMIDKLK